MAEDEILTKAKELDAMERSVTSAEADILERVLEAYSDGKKPKIKDCEKVQAMYDKYLGKREDDPEDETADRLGEEFVDEEEDDLEALS